MLARLGWGQGRDWLDSVVFQAGNDEDDDGSNQQLSLRARIMLSAFYIMIPVHPKSYLI